MTKLKDLPPNPQNPRKITDEKLAMLDAAIAEFGSLDGFIFNRRFKRLCGGHQRQKLDPEATVVIEHEYPVPTKAGTVAHGFILLKGERFPYRVVDWDENVEKAANIAANKGAGDWDFPLLSDWFIDLDHQNYNVDLTMFDANERENIVVGKLEEVEGECDADEAAEPPPNPKSKKGDIFILGNHRLICGDATSESDIAALMKNEKADMVWTDPPYNVAYEGKTKEAMTIENDSMGDADFYKFLYDSYSNMLMFTHGGGAIYVAHADSEGANFRKAMTDAGWLLKQCLIWVKNSLVMGRQDYHWKHEPILYGWAPGDSHSWYSDRTQTTVLDFKRPSRNGEHPTMKPVELVSYMIGNSSKNGNVVLDLFGGSGTTMIACEKMGRSARLSEIDPRYCDVILNRWAKFTGKDPIHDDGTPWSVIKNNAVQS